MTKKVIIFAILALMLSAGSVMAQDVKIALLDTQRVMRECQPGIKAKSDLETALGGIQDQLKQKEDELRTMTENLEKQAMVLSDEARSQKETELKQKIREYQEFRAEVERKIQTEQQRLLQPVLEFMTKVAERYSEEQNFTIVLELTEAGVLYHDAGLEITDELIIEIDKAWAAQ